MHASLLFNRDRPRQRKSHASKTVTSIPAGLVTERTCKRQRRRQFLAPADRSVREAIHDRPLKLRSIQRREALARTNTGCGIAKSSVPENAKRCNAAGSSLTPKPGFCGGMRNAFSNWDFKADRLLFPVSSPHLSLLVMELLHRYSGLSSG